MLALLLCLVSLTRHTFRYFTNKVFSNIEPQSSPCSRQTAEDTTVMDPPIVSDNEQEIQDEDDNVIDENVSPSTAPSTTKRRANSVIDSMGGSNSFTPSGYVIPRRTRSHPTEEVSSDQEYSIVPDHSEAPRPGWLLRRADAVDANVQSVTNDDDYRSRKTISVTLPVHRDAICYNMNHKRRGRCVIFNHEKFETGFSERQGSTADALRIQETFSNLGYKVDILDNYCHSEVIATINKLSEEDHTDCDSICIFVLTHGLSNDLISARDVAYRSDNIWKPFTADKCQSLAGKPKLFFFQACRGDQLDNGVMVCRSAERTETDSSVASYKIPTHADFLIAHSTVQGFLSWRDPEEGTWYIQCLCDTIDQYWKTTDLLSILTITARKVATEYTSHDDLNPARHEQKQVPSVTSMLIRDIYFTPK